MLDLRPGYLIHDRYQIIKPLSSGGFGATYLAKDLKKCDAPCVVKHLCPARGNSDDLKQRFADEAQKLYQFDKSDKIPTLLAFERQDGELYIIQEWIDGQDLSHELVRGRKHTEAEVIQLVREILTVLHILHHKLVIHRDLKPANIMRRRSDRQLMLIDFGFAKEITQSVYEGKQGKWTHEVMTPGYTASEQLRGYPSLGSDIYSVGAIAVQALTGRPPHELYDEHKGEIVWRNQVKVTGEFRQVLEQMLFDRPQDRYPNAQAALNALVVMDIFSEPLSRTIKVSPAATSKAVPNKPINPTLPTVVVNKPQSRRRFLNGLGFMGLGAVGVGVVGHFLQQRNRAITSFQFETVQLDDRGTVQTQQTLKADRFIEILGRNLGLSMVKIESGIFLMGSPSSETNRYASEDPQHIVSVPTFFMAQTPVTQEQWRFVAKLPKIEIDLNVDPSTFKGDRRPVETVSWWEAKEFCDRLSQFKKLDYRLPSEAEWEYACRSGTKTPFHFGNTITTAVANYDGNYSYGNGVKGEYRNQTTAVEMFYANAWGLYDMHGNVWEWCEDHGHSSYQDAPTDGSAWLSNNPRILFGLGSGLCVLRGGSWYASPQHCRSAVRHSNQSDRHSDVGFRVVCRLSS